VNREDIRAYAERDWAALAREKLRHSVEQKAGMSAARALAVSEALRRHATCVKPGWPDESERAADLAVHLRISKAFRAVSRQRLR
jgi:hypothetical protein